VGAALAGPVLTARTPHHTWVWKSLESQETHSLRVKTIEGTLNKQLADKSAEVAGLMARIQEVTADLDLLRTVRGRERLQV